MKRLTYLVLAASLFLTMTPAIGQAKTLKACMTDDFGQTWSLTSVSTGGGNWIITGTLDVFLASPWIVTGSGNSNTSIITLTATNPFPDECGYVDYFTYSGVSKPVYTGGTWASFCNSGPVGNGTWTAGVNKGLCEILLGKPGLNGPAMPNFKQDPGSFPINGNNQVSIFDFGDEAISISASPNPASDRITVSYTMEENNQVNVAVYNFLGQEVKVLVNETKPAGTYSVNWDVTNVAGASVPKGIYYLRVQTNSGLQTHAITIEK